MFIKHNIKFGFISLAKFVYPKIAKLTRSERKRMNDLVKSLAQNKEVGKIISLLQSEWQIPHAEAEKYAQNVCRHSKSANLSDKKRVPISPKTKNKTDLMQITADRGGSLQEIMEIGIRRGMTRNAAIEKARRLLGKKYKTPYVQIVQGGAPK